MALQHATGFLKIVADAKTRIKECTIDEMLASKANGDQFVLVDVREESEWNAGRIPGSVHIGKGVIERDVEAKISDRDTPLVLYCGGGFRSALVADNLQKMGYTHVISMDGGVRGWKDKGLPLVI